MTGIHHLSRDEHATGRQAARPHPKILAILAFLALSVDRAARLTIEGAGEAERFGEIVGALGGRQAREERFAVPLGVDAPIEDGDDARVLPRADEPAESLLQRDG